MTFEQKYRSAAQTSNTRVCVGLDPDPLKLPSHFDQSVSGVTTFLKEVIDATHDLACAFKPNFAFFGALGPAGIATLSEIIHHVPDTIPVILDFKAGDIGNTAEKYAEMAYDVLNADAVTLNPYMGWDTVEPFLRSEDKCVFLLCLTSNPSSQDFQRVETEQGPLFEVVARQATKWSEHGSCGLVVGATHPGDLPRVRKLSPNLPFLIPGVGSQGGNPVEILKQASSPDGFGTLINASRSILYASSGEDFGSAARQATEDLRKSLQGT